jgi:farnesyl diphosphate synthase
MDFTQRLKQTAEQVDARLSTFLSAAGRNETADTSASLWPERLAAAARHASLGGGKRLRPFLVIESAALFGVETAQSLNAAAAIECVHCYSLVHDDLPAMDDDALRRGQPTVWKAYDEWTAILAGDALLTLAFEILGDPRTHPSAEVRSDLVFTLARASGGGGMAGGQALDLDASKRGVPANPGIDHVARLQAMKTGALITCACEMGAILGRAEDPNRSVLRRFGQALGSAFQIADDLLDAEGDEAAAGKAVAKDAAAGKATLVGLMGIDTARERLRELEHEAVTALSPFGSHAGVLIQAARFVSRRQS